MRSNELVTILTPCFNGEKYLERYFNSILKQTYQSVELIFINDGSTDNTEKIALSYIEKFEKKGYQFIYMYQENNGAASALNTGLKKVTGRYLIWPDSDDELTEDSIEVKINFLKNNPQYSIVVSDWEEVKNNNNQKTKISKLKNSNLDTRDLFKDLIMEKDIWFCCGSYMLVFDDFVSANKGKDIFIDMGGQNYQMLLPMFSEYKCGYLKKVSYKYYVHNDSHSHKSDYNHKLNNARCQEATIIETVRKLGRLEEVYSDIEIKYIRRRMNIAIMYKRKEDFMSEYSKLKEKNKINFEDRIRYLMINYNFLYLIYAKVRIWK